MVSFRKIRRYPLSQTRARHFARLAAAACVVLGLGAAEIEPLIPDSLLHKIAGELSVENALKETAAVASHTRYPDSQGFFDTAEYVASRAREYGLQNVHIERFPVSAPMWDAAEATLATVSPKPLEIPAVLAQRSASADVTAELTTDTGNDLGGKVLLTDQEPARIWRALGDRKPLAVLSAATGEYFGRHTPASGILWSEAPRGAVALMISPQDGEQLRSLAQSGPVTVRIHALAKSSSPGAMGIVMGEIPGAIGGEDVVLAAHLDHQLPGANDNASGAGTLLELARVVGKMARPHRSIRFWWTTEIESEQAWFRQHPEDARRILLSVVLDQAGGERGAENNLVVIHNPGWLPSYADDLIDNLAQYVYERYAPAEHEPDPLVSAQDGGRQSLRPAFWDYQPLTDSAAFAAKDVGIPGISLAVPSLDLIHTNLDTVDRLDPTWMKRSALLTLASALYVANAGSAEARALLEYTFRQSAARLATSGDPAKDLDAERKRLDSVRALDRTLDTSAWKQRLAAAVQALRQN
jgi:hypothetical protein